MPHRAAPPALKDAGAYVQRANEVEGVDPVMAYWCMSHG